MSYKESEKRINDIRHRDEILFRMAVSHLIDVGIRHLTDENVSATCESIMQEDDSTSASLSEQQESLRQSTIFIYLFTYQRT